MITRQDLDQAIAECQGQRNPNASTCLKLASYYTIRNEMFREMPSYSYDPGPQQAENTIDYDSGTEFGEAIRGRDSSEIWPIIDEAMTAIRVIHPRLYAGVMRKIEQ